MTLIGVKTIFVDTGASNFTFFRSAVLTTLLLLDWKALKNYRQIRKMEYMLFAKESLFTKILYYERPN